jgi:hypothetical protein
MKVLTMMTTTSSIHANPLILTNQLSVLENTVIKAIVSVATAEILVTVNGGKEETSSNNGSNNDDN